MRPRRVDIASPLRGACELAPPLLEIAVCGAAHDHAAGAGGDGLRESAVDDAGGDDVAGEGGDRGAGEGVGCCVGFLWGRRKVSGPSLKAGGVCRRTYSIDGGGVEGLVDEVGKPGEPEGDGGGIGEGGGGSGSEGEEEEEKGQDEREEQHSKP